MSRRDPDERDLDEDTMNRLEQLLSRPEPPPAAVSPHTLRRLAAGDLPDAEAAAARAAISEDPAAAERLAALQAEDRAFLAARPFAAVQDELRRRAEALPAEPARRGLLGRWLQPRSLGWALAAVATALLLGVLLPETPTDPVGPSPNRLKGAATLSAWQQTAGDPARLEDGVTLGAGDAIQFTVTTTASHLALLGVDGTGTVSRYLPVGGDVSLPFTPGTHRPLPDAFVLDDAPGPEVFLAFLSDEPLLVEDLERAVHDALDDGGPDAVRDLDPRQRGIDADVATFVAHKEDAPR